jgi:hypothetical protein
MKIMNYFKSAKGILIRISFLLFLGLCINLTSNSNPILPPPMIQEIYFSSGEVFIELLIPMYWGEGSLDNIRMTGLYDTAQFHPGIEYTPGEVFYITGADFETPININQYGDCINLEEFYGGGWSPFDYYGLQFGNVTWSEVSAPIGEESIARQEFSEVGYDIYDYWTVKELPNTIGSSPFQVSKRAEFSGYVKDANDDPIAGIILHYAPSRYFYYSFTPHVPEISTDQYGYFHTDHMFCKKFDIRFLFEEGEIGDTTIFVEPDSANYFEFKLDTLLTGMLEYKAVPYSYSISNIPNPFSNNTTFVIETNIKVQNQKGLIKIYSSEGFILEILPIEISGEKQELNYNLNDKSLAAGIYYYSLEIGHQKVATGKMVISL